MGLNSTQATAGVPMDQRRWSDESELLPARPQSCSCPTKGQFGGHRSLHLHCKVPTQHSQQDSVSPDERSVRWKVSQVIGQPDASLCVFGKSYWKANLTYVSFMTLVADFCYKRPRQTLRISCLVGYLVVWCELRTIEWMVPSLRPCLFPCSPEGYFN